MSVGLEEVRRIARECRRGEAAWVDETTFEQQADLVALAWLGSGLYRSRELCEARFEARAAQDHRTAGYLASLADLGCSLERAMQHLTDADVWAGALH